MYNQNPNQKPSGMPSILPSVAIFCPFITYDNFIFITIDFSPTAEFVMFIVYHYEIFTWYTPPLLLAGNAVEFSWFICIFRYFMTAVWITIPSMKLWVLFMKLALIKVWFWASFLPSYHISKCSFSNPLNLNVSGIFGCWICAGCSKANSFFG